MKKEYEILKNADKVVLAYSGGLDTSIMISWLKEHGVKKVICVSADLGQVKDSKKLEEKALKSGADKFYNLDLTEEFLRNYAFKALKAGAKYENQYYLGTALARPIIAKSLVEIAKKENSDIIVHGCTGKGNDQIRFEVSIMALAPEIKVIAPWRFWKMKGRSDEIAYANARGIEVNVGNEEKYSEDENIWHISHEGLDLEDISKSADYKKILKWVCPLEECKDEAEIISIGFEKGNPVSINDIKLDSVSLITKLNEIGGRNGIGVCDIIESRMVGMKSRGLYENPGASILYAGHEILESATVYPDTLKYKQKMALDYAELYYGGKVFTNIMESMDAFIEVSQENVTGTVKLKLYKGNIIPYGIEAKNPLYKEDLASFEADQVYDQYDATGFIKLYGLATKVYAQGDKQ
ncbi:MULTISPECIES: argininosuccinate synthase [Helcococcus]|uniref:Argininosuccinate synthase n=1 Tax=Helcococcus bovis TaxID=3153252 RepID=A0ABW9F7G9_9FIRM